MKVSLNLKAYKGLQLERKFYLRRAGARLQVDGYSAELHVKPEGLPELVYNQANGRLVLDAAADEWTLLIPGAETALWAWQRALCYMLFVQPSGKPLDPVRGQIVVVTL